MEAGGGRQKKRGKGRRGDKREMREGRQKVRGGEVKDEEK